MSDLNALLLVGLNAGMVAGILIAGLLYIFGVRL
jgi:hypothetical protein